MPRRFLGQIVQGKEVRDYVGNRVGTVAQVHREEVEIPGPDHDDVIEVKTGFLGLGERLYIPVSAVDADIDVALVIGKPKDEFNDDWRKKPENLDRLS